MARNQEKAQSTLNRFLQLQKGGPEKIERRPIFAHEVTDIKQAERWRKQVIREISKESSIIQDGKLRFAVAVAVGEGEGEGEGEGISVQGKACRLLPFLFHVEYFVVVLLSLSLAPSHALSLSLRHFTRLARRT